MAATQLCVPSTRFYSLLLGAHPALLATELGQQCWLGQLSLPMPQIVRLVQGGRRLNQATQSPSPRAAGKRYTFPIEEFSIIACQVDKTYLQERMTHKTSKHK